MVSVAGLKAKDPELSVVMVTFIVEPEGAVVGVGVGAAVVGVTLTVVGVLPAGVLVGAAGAPVVVALPQAASRTRAPSVNRQNQLRVRNFAVNMFLGIFLLKMICSDSMKRITWWKIRRQVTK